MRVKYSHSASIAATLNAAAHHQLSGNCWPSTPMLPPPSASSGSERWSAPNANTVSASRIWPTPKNRMNDSISGSALRCSRGTTPRYSGQPTTTAPSVATAAPHSGFKPQRLLSSQAP
ncbi:hypothetical protein GALL_380390 [mine drainage metagenome]|uniref:Uncharacterized protein n=1 Tax=mine drainage metagenome TaxID=410659 RepID=A0A1J5QJP5_9ZZZZ